MGNGEIWGIGELGNLHDIFHQMLICPVDALLDLGLRAHIEIVRTIFFLFTRRCVHPAKKLFSH